ncbi:hypothetical protein O9X99_02025 [Agrobacterium salinitolerans]|uniref:GNAT family N-acetyltransferase n=1 Tax=Agrobacterium salinitolerans TaxID=1183413 RepID=A0ABY3BWD5_9HYPH|nr:MULTISPECIES: hypothetical protein [Agrobacterium]MCZ7890445.1 hypothetical protein [Agrobacterium salinitolerans]TRA96833.1 hypothetical protein EXN23_00930 [Agrobacterium salinitolerans]
MPEDQSPDFNVYSGMELPSFRVWLTPEDGPPIGFCVPMFTQRGHEFADACLFVLAHLYHDYSLITDGQYRRGQAIVGRIANEVAA